MNYQEQLEIESKHNLKLNEFINDNKLGEELCEFYKSHTQEETINNFNIDGIKQLRRILKRLGFDFSYKKKNSVLKGKKSNRSHESYIQGGKKSSDTQKANWANKSDDELKDWSNKMRESHLTSEYREIKLIQNRDYWNSLSEEEKSDILKKRSKSMTMYWDSLSPEEKKSKIEYNLSQGAGWNHDTIKQTNIDRYGVENQFQRSDVEWNYNHQDSGPNILFKELLLKNKIDFEVEFPIKNRSYDFKIGNILIEINPYPTHNSTWGIKGGLPKDKHYHRDKTNLAIENGYRCIHVWDWDDPNKIIELLNKNEKIYARDCEIKDVSKNESIEFLNKHHLQGYALDSIRIGLYYHKELISIMTFGKPRYNKNYEFELVRYCSIKNIIGGSEKLFKYFITIYNPNSVISYCDRSKFNGDTYTKLNFNLLRVGDGSRHWFNTKTGEHYTDNMIRKLGADKILKTNYGKGTSNNEILRLHNFVEIYDSGQSTYIWTPNNA